MRQNNLSTKKIVPLLASIMVHVIVIGLMIVRLDFYAPMPKLGESQEQILPSYMFHESAPRVIPVQKTQPLPAKAAVKLNKQVVVRQKQPPASVQKKIAAAPRQTVPVQPAPKPQPQMQGNGQPVPELIALLHEAIQKQQQYPANALEMEREGRITLKFMLHTNGTIDHLRIVKSSGTSSLDAAAIAAVNNAAPFRHVDKYLHEAQEYQIDVVFELT